jgi:signal transduction histidine kinase
MNLSVSTFATVTEPAALRLAAMAQSQGMTSRLFAAALAGLLLSTWLGWMAAVWFLVVLVWDAGIAQYCYSRFVLPNIDANPVLSERRAAALCLVGGSIYVTGWGGAWMVGGAPAAMLAGIWFGVTLIHALVYFSNTRLVFVACLLPPTIMVAVVPIAMQLDLWAMAAIVLVAVQAIVLSVSAANDRNLLIETVAAQSAARQAAEDASTAKSQFMANMSHELRTPLNAVIGYSEILEEDLVADGRSDGAADAARIRKAARHLLGLINEVLDLSKIEAGRMEVVSAPCNVLQVLADAVEQTRPLAEANGNRLSLAAPAALDPAFTDGGKLAQCLLNLLSNAAKFTANGTIHVSLKVEGGAMTFVVADSGCGIAPADAKRLFQPFTQVDESLTRRTGGTGLGLVITRRLAGLMGGDVTFESTPGVGSVFSLRLPYEAVARPGTAEGPCILVVEDEAAARDITCRALAALPFQVRTAATVADGLAAFRALEPALVVLDLQLPDGPGWDVLAEVRRTRPATPVLVLTVDDDRARALARGASEHMQKPADREALVSAVLRLTAAQALAA